MAVASEEYSVADIVSCQVIEGSLAIRNITIPCIVID
jgi:hypothetical protein